jgi:hypothetical protein
MVCLTVAFPRQQHDAGKHPIRSLITSKSISSRSKSSPRRKSDPHPNQIPPFCARESLRAFRPGGDDDDDDADNDVSGSEAALHPPYLKANPPKPPQSPR